MRARNALASFAVLTCALIACSGGDGAKRTPTPVAPGTITPLATAAGSVTPAPDIRALDVRAVPAVLDLVSATQGSVNPADVLYDDVTGDRIAEAVVPVASGGSAGNVALLVLTPDGAGARGILRLEATGVVADVEDGHLVVTVPAPGPDDPNCCPSMLKRTIYTWDGSSLAPGASETVPNPDAGAKPTSTPGGAGRPPPQPAQ